MYTGLLTASSTIRQIENMPHRTKFERVSVHFRNIRFPASLTISAIKQMHVRGTQEGHVDRQTVDYVELVNEQ